MATRERYQDGSLAERWTNGTQQGEAASGYYAGSPVARQRALNASEAADLSALDASLTTANNQQTIQQKVDADIATLQSWVAAHPSGATLTAGQTLTVANMLIGLGKLVRGALNDTTGT